MNKFIIITQPRDMAIYGPLNQHQYSIYNSKKRIKGYRILEMSIFRFLKLNPFYLQIQTFSFLRVI